MINCILLELLSLNSFIYLLFVTLYLHMALYKKCFNDHYFKISTDSQFVDICNISYNIWTKHIMLNLDSYI